MSQSFDPDTDIAFTHTPAAIRAALRADLIGAMKSRDRDAVTALRTTLAAIDNAEAVETTGPHAPHTSGNTAEAGTGAGSTEVPRRELTTRDVRAILRAQVADRITGAAAYDAHGQTHAADRLRREAATLARYIEP